MRYMYWRVPSRGNLRRRKVFYQPWSLHRVRYMRKRMSSGGYQPCWIISIIQGLTAGSVALSRFFWRHKDRIGWRIWFFWGKDKRTWEQVVFEKTEEHENMFLFWRHEDMRTCCCLKRQKNMRTCCWGKTEEQKNRFFKNRRMGICRRVWHPCHTHTDMSIQADWVVAITLTIWVYSRLSGYGRDAIPSYNIWTFYSFTFK